MILNYRKQNHIFSIYFVRILFKNQNYKIRGGGLNFVAHGHLSHRSVEAPMKVGRLSRKIRHVFADTFLSGARTPDISIELSACYLATATLQHLISGQHID